MWKQVKTKEDRQRSKGNELQHAHTKKLEKRAKERQQEAQREQRQRIATAENYPSSSSTRSYSGLNDGFVVPSSKDRALASFFSLADDLFRRTHRQQEQQEDEGASKKTSVLDDDNDDDDELNNCNQFLESVAAASFSVADAIESVDDEDKYPTLESRRTWSVHLENNSYWVVNPNKMHLSIFSAMKSTESIEIANELGDIRPQVLAITTQNTLADARNRNSACLPTSCVNLNASTNFLSLALKFNNVTALTALVRKCVPRKSTTTTTAGTTEGKYVVGFDSLLHPIQNATVASKIRAGKDVLTYASMRRAIYFFASRCASYQSTQPLMMTRPWYERDQTELTHAEKLEKRRRHVNAIVAKFTKDGSITSPPMFSSEAPAATFVDLITADAEESSVSGRDFELSAHTVVAKTPASKVVVVPPNSSSYSTLMKEQQQEKKKNKKTSATSREEPQKHVPTPTSSLRLTNTQRSILKEKTRLWRERATVRRLVLRLLPSSSSSSFSQQESVVTTFSPELDGILLLDDEKKMIPASGSGNGNRSSNTAVQEEDNNNNCDNAASAGMSPSVFSNISPPPEHGLSLHFSPSHNLTVSAQVLCQLRSIARMRNGGHLLAHWDHTEVFSDKKSNGVAMYSGAFPHVVLEAWPCYSSSSGDDGIPRVQRALPAATLDKTIELFKSKHHTLSAGNPCFASRDVFLKKWEQYSAGVLDGFSSPYAYVMGGSVVCCLDPCESRSADGANRDIDIFFAGLTDEGVHREILRLDAFMTETHHGGDETKLLTVRSSVAVTYVLPFPKPRVQVVLGAWPSVGSLLSNADVDCTSCALSLNRFSTPFSSSSAGSGSNDNFFTPAAFHSDVTSSSSGSSSKSIFPRVFLTPRGFHAWLYRINVPCVASNAVRGSPGYEERLLKYAKRDGFAVVHPLTSPSVRALSGTGMSIVSSYYSTAVKKFVREEIEKNQEQFVEAYLSDGPQKVRGLPWLWMMDKELFPSFQEPATVLQTSESVSITDVREALKSHVAETEYATTSPYIVLPPPSTDDDKKRELEAAEMAHCAVPSLPSSTSSGRGGGRGGGAAPVASARDTTTGAAAAKCHGNGVANNDDDNHDDGEGMRSTHHHHPTTEAARLEKAVAELAPLTSAAPRWPLEHLEFPADGPANDTSRSRGRGGFMGMLRPSPVPSSDASSPAKESREAVLYRLALRPEDRKSMYLDWHQQKFY